MLILSQACVLDPIDLSRFHCPCTNGYECEPTTERCVPVDDGDGVVHVANLRADWTTPNWIRWSWHPEAPHEQQLARYELFVAESIDDLLERSGTTRRFDPETNPELARYTLPRSGSAEVVDGTFSQGHTPDSEYLAVLVATDTSGRTRRSNIAPARTGAAPTESLVIIDEENPPGYEIPPSQCYRWIEGDGGFGGSGYFLREHVCTGDNDHLCEPNTDTEECWVNLNTQGMGLSLEPITEADFDRAYLELALYNDGATTSFWSHAGIHLRTQDDERTLWLYEEITFPPKSDYVVYQIKLDQIPINDPERDLILSFEDIATAELYGYRIGGSFQNGAHIRLDAITIRW